MDDTFGTLVKKLNNKAIAEQVQTGKATNIDARKRTCDIVLEEHDGLTLYDCRLNAVVDSYDNYLVVLPKEGSTVVFVQIGGNPHHCLVIACSGIDGVAVKAGSNTVEVNSDGIVLNGGDLGGLIKIDQLTQKLNNLVRAFNAHTHTVTVGSSSGTAASITSQAARFNKNDYQDNNVKH